MSPLSFLLDENASFRLAVILREHGHTVSTVQELGKRGIQNSELREFAHARKHILITYDREFLSLVPYPDEQIIVITVHPNVDRKVLPVFKRFLESFDFAHLPGALIRVSEEEFVIRKSPERE